MERRVAGIIRWLERCVKAYKDGAVESALMDAECARADVETLRDELWKKLEGRRCAQSRRFHPFRAAEALFGAIGIILITAAPLALPQDRLTRERRVEEYFTLEWVTPDERELLGNVRKRPEESLALIVKPEAPVIPVAEVQTLPSRTVEPARRRSPELPSPRDEQKKPHEANLTYDSILSLIEAGERAMKNESPAIKVENTSGK